LTKRTVILSVSKSGNQYLQIKREELIELMDAYTIRKKDGKEHRYWSIVENRRLWKDNGIRQLYYISVT